MKILARTFIGIFFLIQINFIFAQENESSEPSVYSEFNTFFENEIKHQGIKGDWIFKLNEITGLHKFDYNSDGFNDIFLDFNAIPIDGGGHAIYFSVLFQNEENQRFSFVNYVETDELKFVEFNNSLFVFRNTNNNIFQNYSLINSKFIRTN